MDIICVVYKLLNDTCQMKKSDDKNEILLIFFSIKSYVLWCSQLSYVSEHYSVRFHPIIYDAQLKARICCGLNISCTVLF